MAYPNIKFESGKKKNNTRSIRNDVELASCWTKERLKPYWECHFRIASSDHINSFEYFAISVILSIPRLTKRLIVVDNGNWWEKERSFAFAQSVYLRARAVVKWKKVIAFIDGIFNIVLNLIVCYAILGYFRSLLLAPDNQCIAIGNDVIQLLNFSFCYVYWIVERKIGTRCKETGGLNIHEIDVSVKSFHLLCFNTNIHNLLLDSTWR